MAAPGLGRSPVGLRAASLGVAVCLAIPLLAGCKSGPAPDVVEAETRNPNGQNTAYVVQRTEPGGPADGESYVVVLPNDQLPLGRADLANSAVLQAARAPGLRLQWTSAEDLKIICDGCAVQAADIRKQTDHSGPTRITYEGFPPRAGH